MPHQFNKDVDMSGKKWYYQFMKHHPRLCLRLPKQTSMARATDFCREKVELFFSKLAQLVDNHNITVDLLYNVDEAGISTVQKPMKDLAIKSEHQVEGITSSESGLNATRVYCINVVGPFIPPKMIFKRKNFKNELKDRAPLLTSFGCSDRDWTTSTLFYFGLSIM